MRVKIWLHFAYLFTTVTIISGVSAGAGTLTKEWLDSAPLEELGEQVAKNVEKRFEKSNANKKFTNHEDTYLADPVHAKIRIHTDLSALQSILTSGEILNQHDTKYSGGGGYDPSERLGLEEALAGFKFDKEMKRDRRTAKLLPKYGVVEFHDFANDPIVRSGWELKSGTDVLNGYGDVIIYLKDEVKKRTTVFPSDTGNGFFGKLEDLGQSLSQKQVRIIFHQVERGDFFEAEIWGPLKVDQIESVAMSESDLKSNPKLRKLLVQQSITVKATVPYSQLTVEDKAKEAFRIVPIGKTLIEGMSSSTSKNRCTQIFEKIAG